MDKLNGSVFKGMLISGCNHLNNQKKDVDALNVFPVPDGDTGTNMSLTFTNGVSEVNKSGSEQLPIVAKTLSRGLLMGARGNSGVILSQIFRGFYQYVGDREELTTKEFAEAMLNGAKLAYKAVMRPVEGTILTVVRESADYADVYMEQNPQTSLEEYMDILCKEAKASLDRTPELLPILKEARVVDSGGSGLVAVLEGFRAFLEGNPIEALGESAKQSAKEVVASGYCTEFILRLSDQGQHLYKEDRFRSSLEKLGNNITLIQDGDVLKVRVNTVTPGEILNLGQRYGEFDLLQIDNLQKERHPSILDAVKEEPIEEKEFGVITVAAGDGLKKLFTDFRADIVVSGGQTMNPSTEDFVEAIKKIPAKVIYILPNNSNIIMAAQQAASVSSKHVIVFETKSIPQGLAACIAFNPELSEEENTNNMLQAISNVKSASVTYAIKDTSIDGKKINAGDYMGIYEKDILLTGKDKVETTCRLLKEICDEDSEIITIIQGEDATDEECRQIQEFIDENFDVDVDVQKGGQPVYSFMIGIE